MQLITSAQNPKLKDAIRLHTSRGRKRQNRIIIFGWREVERAAKSNRVAIREVFVRADVFDDSADNGTIDKEAIVQIAAQAGSIGLLLPPELFAKLAYGDRSDGVIAVADRPAIGPAAGILDGLAISENGMVVVLESLENPGNLGAIIRSADGAGADAVIVCDGLTDPFHPNAIRNSVGTVFSMPLAIASSAETVQWLAAGHFDTFAAIVDAERSLYESDLSNRCAIVLGNEARGLSAQWRNADLKSVSLPMLGSADSLNVSVSASIMIYEARRQRSAG